MSTPTPWRVFNENGVISVMESGSNKEIIHWAGFDSSSFQKENLANAQLIVTAVNAHDDLVGALTFLADKTNDPALVAIADAALRKVPRNT